MWRSHNTSDGHYDVWHCIYSDNDHHVNPPSIQTIPPLNKKNDIRNTPCVSLHQKGRYCYNHLYLCDRPYSPFSGFYDQDDVYVGSEYDVFGGESVGSPEQVTLSSSPTSTTTIEEEDLDHHHMDIFSDDPFSIPHLDDTPIINRSSSSVMATKRIRTNDHAMTLGDNDYIMTLKRRKTIGNIMESSSTYTHHELPDYALCIFSSEMTPSSPIPVDSMLEYN